MPKQFSLQSATSISLGLIQVVQVGWADSEFQLEGADVDDGVGDDSHSWGIDGSIWFWVPLCPCHSFKKGGTMSSGLGGGSQKS